LGTTWASAACIDASRLPAASGAHNRRRNTVTAEGAGDLVAQRLGQVRQQAALAGADEQFGRHPAAQLQVLRGQRLAVDLHPHAVECRAGVGIGRAVGGDIGHLAGDLRRAGIGERGEADTCLLADRQLVDVRRPDHRLDHRQLAAGHDLHDRLGRPHDIADGGVGELFDRAGIGRADFRLLLLHVGRDAPHRLVVERGIDLLELAGGVDAARLVDLDGLLAGFADVRVGLGDVGLQRGDLPVDARRRALELVELADRDQLLLPQLAHVVELGLDQRELALQRSDLRVIAAVLLAVLGDARLQLRVHLGLLGLAGGEQLELVGHRLGGRRRPGVEQRGSEHDAARAALLRFQPRALGEQLFDRQAGILRLGAGHLVLQPHQQLALLDLLAVLDQDRGDRAAGRVGDALDPRFHADRAAGDDRAADRHHRRKQQQHQQQAAADGEDPPGAGELARFRRVLVGPDLGDRRGGR
jgi:hypothetical protein